jgi:PAS domain S-box-containing protein
MAAPVQNESVESETKVQARLTEFQVALDQELAARLRMETKYRQFSRAVEQCPCSIVITDAAGTIEYTNPRFSDLTGYTAEEARGQNPRILKGGLMPSRAYAELWKTLTSGQEWRGEFHNRKKNGELYWESASISPVINSEGKITHYVAVKENITERKRAEAERDRLIQELQEVVAKVRTLSGLLPICASCKKIRDDQGYWHQVEEYIQAHSQAQFSHGLCPECAHRMFPDFSPP